MQVAGLNIHPLKSGRAIAVEQAEVAPDGFCDDRRFMLVGPDGVCVTQRDLQMLAQLEARAVAGGLHLTLGAQTLSAQVDGATRMSVRIWDDTVDAAVAGAAVNETLTAWFGRPLRLVHMGAHAARAVSGDWSGAPAPVGFADGFPILVTTTGSLAALNRTLEDMGQPPVGMDRFRTNILVAHDAPWEEDLWEAIEIGGIRFDLVKPCARCIMTTQDQETGARIGGNPIQALAVERMSADRRVPGVLFGWNAVPRAEGTIALADTVTVVATRTERWPIKRRG